jgi:hypothetical protein
MITKIYKLLHFLILFSSFPHNPFQKNIIIIIIKFYIRTSKNNMQETRRQSKRIAESGTGGVLETVKALLPKTRRAPAAAKKPAAPVEPEQPQLAREPAAPQTPLEKELHRLYYDYKFYVGRDKLYWLMQQQQQKAAAQGGSFRTLVTG